MTRLLAGLGRACAGALIFGLPMPMTTEMRELGASMGRLRLVLLILVALPLLVGIAHRVGFEATFGWREDVRDALLALGVAVLTSAGVLAVLGVLPPRRPPGRHSRPGGLAERPIGHRRAPRAQPARR